jgi:hypothetical protein
VLLLNIPSNPITPEAVIVRDEDAEGNITSDIENFTST